MKKKKYVKEVTPLNKAYLSLVEEKLKHFPLKITGLTTPYLIQTQAKERTFEIKAEVKETFIGHYSLEAINVFLYQSLKEYYRNHLTVFLCNFRPGYLIKKTGTQVKSTIIIHFNLDNLPEISPAILFIKEYGEQHVNQSEAGHPLSTSGSYYPDLGGRRNP